MISNSNRTKIVATVGPSTSSPEALQKLMEGGVSVFRLNFSHGEHADHDKVIEDIRKLNKKLNLHCAILADLQGPKIRCGEIKGKSITLKEGDKLTLTTLEADGSDGRVTVSYKAFPKDVGRNDRILLDDGKIELRVLSSDGKETVETEVIYGGPLSSRKGINLPDSNTSLDSLTKKDLADLEYIMTKSVDWIALSFVRNPKDIQHLRSILSYKGHHTKIIAKVEKPQAVKQIDRVIAESDGVMIARGDLGVEMPMEEVPVIQKMIVEKCNKAARPVIIATQMMESMLENARPSRAEVTDVANAIFDGADAVMLSGETAVGKYPNKVIEIIQKIIHRVEKEERVYNKNLLPDKDSETFLSDAMCYNACKISDDVGAKAIIGMTRSGYTGFMTSSYRPKAHVFVFSDSKEIITTLNLVWGVTCIYYDRMVSTDDTIFDVHQILKKKGYIAAGDLVVNLASMPLHKQGRTNMVKVSRID